MSQAHPEDKTLADKLATREIDYKRTATLCDTFVKGMVQTKRVLATGAHTWNFKTKGGTNIWDPFVDEKGQSNYTLASCTGAVAVDPWEYYGKPFCESQLVTAAIAYAATLPDTAKAQPAQTLRKHPLYPKAGFAP